MYGFAAALMLVAFIASIVLTVMGYKKFIGGAETLSRIDPRDQRTWGPFLRFDTLIIDKVLKALYMFNAIFFALALCVGVISSLSQGFGTFVAAILGGAIALVVGELVLRLCYELIMMTVVIARNTSEIKRAMVGGEVADSDGISPLEAAPVASQVYTYEPAPVVAPAPVAEPAPVAAPEPVAEPAPVAEPEPVAEPALAICPVCGQPVSPDDKFCAFCGAKLQ